MMEMFFENENSVLYKSYRRQLIASLILDIVAFSHGVGTGIMSPTLLKMQSDNSPYKFAITVHQASWIGALISIGAMIGNIIFTYLKELLGRKKAAHLVAVPHLCLWLMFFFATDVRHLYLARIFGGIAGGGVNVIVPIFISEIADCKIRGTLASLFIFSLNCGILAGFILASHLYFFAIPCLMLCPAILFICLWTKIPETPIHLIHKGFYHEAEDSLKYYKNHHESTPEANEKFNSEFNNLITFIESTMNQKSGTLRDFSNKKSLKALAIGVTLIFVFVGSGTFTILNYSSLIFEKAGSARRILTFSMLYSEVESSNTDPNMHTIVIGVVQVAGALCATILVDKHGRKILLLVSSSGMCLGLTAIGLYSYLMQHTSMPKVTWFPPLMMSMVVFIANIGILAVTFVTIIEVLPPNIRTMGTSFCMLLMSIFSFIILKTFPILMAFAGLPGALWMCASIAGYGFFFFLKFLRETKRMPLFENN